MAFVSEMVDELRLLLNDATDSQVPITTKRLYLNNAINRLWPRIFRIEEAVVTTTLGTYEYSLPKTTYFDMPVILSVEYSYDGTTANYVRYSHYDVIDGSEDTDGYLRVATAVTTGGKLRIRYARPCATIVGTTYVAMQSETWVGPDPAMRLCVFYAMGMITSSKLDDRQDALRYSTTQATNGVTDNDIIQSSGMWFAQFDAEIEELARPYPVSRD